MTLVPLTGLRTIPMDAKRIYNIRNDAVLEYIERLLNYFCNNGFSFSFVVRKDIVIDQDCHDVIRRFAAFVVEVRDTTEWPGTQLLDGVATVYRYLLSRESVLILMSYRMNIHRWVHPRFPEDLCFYASSGDPCFVTISHEADSYFMLSRPQLDDLAEKLPDLCSSSLHSQSCKSGRI
jgi:hypothetical protein